MMIASARDELTITVKHDNRDQIRCARDAPQTFPPNFNGQLASQRHCKSGFSGFPGFISYLRASDYGENIKALTD